MVAAVLCCLPLFAATVMVYSVPGSRSVRVVVVTSLGTVSWNREDTVKHKLNGTIALLCVCAQYTPTWEFVCAVLYLLSIQCSSAQFFTSVVTPEEDV